MYESPTETTHEPPAGVPPAAVGSAAVAVPATTTVDTSPTRAAMGRPQVLRRTVCWVLTIAPSERPGRGRVGVTWVLARRSSPRPRRGATVSEAPTTERVGLMARALGVMVAGWAVTL